MNTMYPIFLKTEQLNILIVGGGYVALEKLQFLLKSSPNSKVLLVAPMIRNEVRELVEKFEVTLIESSYKKEYLENKHIVIATTDSPEVNQKVYDDCREKSILVNVADNPPLCDFYMGGIVTKGNLKVAISTNGKSPTLAKRFRQMLEEILPEEIDDLLENLNNYRKTLKGNFEEKTKKLNELTKELITQK